jgi:hypothetical protein
MKKIYLFIVACLLTTATWAQTWQIGSPNAGDVTATLNQATLSIRGTGNMQDYSVGTKLAPWSSQSAEIITVIVEEGVTSIGIVAFLNCTSLAELVLPKSLTRIGSSAFQNCSSLSEVISKNPVPQTSGMYPFNGVNTRTCLLIVPVGSATAYRASDAWRLFNIVEEGAVPMLCYPSLSGIFDRNPNMNWYFCEDGTLTIRGEGFMPNFDLPIKEDDFNPDLFAPWVARRLSIRKVVIEEGAVNLGDAAFYWHYYITEFILPKSLKSIGYAALSNCFSLREIVLPEGLITIGIGAFYYSYNLSKITIPETVTVIDHEAFGRCAALRTMTVKNPVPPMLGNDVFTGVNQAACTLIVPVGSKVAYEAADQWKHFNIVEDNFSSINSIENVEKIVVGYFNLTGQKLSQEPKSGLYIILYDDGTTEKRIKK